MKNTKSIVKESRLLRAMNTIFIAAILIFASVEVVLLAMPIHKEPVALAVEGDNSGDAVADPTADATPASEQATQCVTRMKAFMNVQKDDFGAFMNKNFQSRKPTSELISAAIEKFRIYRKDASEEMDKYFVKAGLTPDAASTEFSSCQTAVNEDFKIMKEVIRSHIKENAVAKKSTRLLDKYQEINKKLDKLNFTIGQMAGYFGTFAQKLPCYATKCNKG